MKEKIPHVTLYSYVMDHAKPFAPHWERRYSIWRCIKAFTFLRSDIEQMAAKPNPEWLRSANPAFVEYFHGIATMMRSY